jgi:hypothetical protein
MTLDQAEEVLAADDSTPMHADTTTTETVYRFQIRPVIQDGATVMDQIFPDDGEDPGDIGNREAR